MSETIIRKPEVKKRTGLSNSSLYVKITTGLFPKPIKLGARAVGWIESDVDRWIEQQIVKSRPHQENGM